jgi:hypothetical protein
MTPFVTSQVLAAAAFVAGIASFQFRRRGAVLACFVAATLLLGIHFWLLDARTAAILAILASVRYTAAIWLPSRRLLYIFLPPVYLIGVLTWSGLLTLVAVTGSTLSAVASIRTNRQLREWSMAASVVWIVHDVLAGSPGAILMESAFLVSNGVGYYRHFRRPVPAHPIAGPGTPS